MTTGERIRYYRKTRKMTQRKLAFLADIALTSLCRYEMDERSPTISTLQRLSDTLGVSLPHLMDDMNCDLAQTPVIPIIVKPGVYRHYKGKFYLVIGTGVHTQTLEPVVIYQALYGHKEMWVRPASMWFEKIEINGKRIPRFEKIEETDFGQKD